jgi:hypothetical protein
MFRCLTLSSVKCMMFVPQTRDMRMNFNDWSEMIAEQSSLFRDIVQVID